MPLITMSYDSNYLPFVDNLQLPPLKKAAHFWFPCQNGCDKIPSNLFLCFVGLG